MLILDLQGIMLKLIFGLDQKEMCNNEIFQITFLKTKLRCLQKRSHELDTFFLYFVLKSLTDMRI